MPLPVDGHFAQSFPVPERPRLLFEDRLKPHVPHPTPMVSFDLDEGPERPPYRILRPKMEKSKRFAFKHKFSLYASQLGWTSEDCFVFVGVLQGGRQQIFYAILLEQKHSLNYLKLLNKLEARFGAKDLPATGQGLFKQATEDWADRIMTLATRDLPEQYSNRQAVVRFYQGLADIEIGHHVCMQEPKVMEQALNGIIC